MLIKPPSIFPARIREVRQLWLYSQGRAAELLGISQPSLCSVEKGKRAPSMELLAKLRRLYGSAAYRYALGESDTAPPRRLRNKLATPRKPYTRKAQANDVT